MTEPKRHVVKPFGLIGGDYEVDGAGLFKYLLACAIAAVVIGVLVFREGLGVPEWAALAGVGVGLLATIGLCADVVRKGRKL